MKKIVFIVLYCSLITSLNAQGNDSAEIKEKNVNKIPTRVIAGDAMNLKSKGVYGVLNADKAFRYKDKIYVVGTSKNYTQFTFIMAYLETKYQKTNIFLLEYDTAGRFIDKIDFELAPNGKEYILNNIEINQLDNQLIALFSVRNSLTRKRIYMLSALNLDRRSTKRIKIASMPLKSKDELKLFPYKETSSLVIKYMKYNVEAKTYHDVSGIRFDKNLNEMNSEAGQDNYDKMYLQHYDVKAGVSYVLTSKGNQYNVARFQASGVKKYVLGIKPDSDKIIRADFDDNNSALYLIIMSKGKDFSGLLVDRIVFDADSFKEKTTPYVSEKKIDSSGILSKLKRIGFRDLLDMQGKDIQRIKEYYYCHSGIFDTSTQSAILIYNIHKEYKVRKREETKHYTRDQNGNRRYSHSTYRWIEEDYYKNGPVLIMIVSPDGNIKYHVLDIINEGRNDLHVDLMSVQTGSGRIHMTYRKSIYYLDLHKNSLSKFSADDALSGRYGETTVIPLNNDFVLLEQNRTKFKLSIIKPGSQ